MVYVQNFPPTSMSRTGERVLGAVLFLLGLLMLGLSWKQAQPGQTFSGSLAAAGPMAAIIGAALVAFPSPFAERRAKGLSDQPGEAPMTPRWMVIAGVAIAAALVHVWLVSQGLVPKI